MLLLLYPAESDAFAEFVVFKDYMAVFEAARSNVAPFCEVVVLFEAATNSGDAACPSSSAAIADNHRVVAEAGVCPESVTT